MSGDERPPQAKPLPPGGGSPASAAHCCRGSEPGGSQSRYEAEQHARGHRQRCSERQYSPIDAETHKERAFSRAEKRNQPTAKRLGQRDSQCRPGNGQQQAFCQKLADQPPARSANSQPYRNLMLARAGAGQQ